MVVSIVAVMDEHRGIGKNGRIPWHIREDLVRFKNLTVGKTVIMGRKTFESVLAYYAKSKNPIPNRKHIVVTHDLTYQPTILGSYVTHSIEEALELAKKIEPNEVIISGGGQLFTQGIQYADKLYLTIVKGTFDADTYFPDYSRFSTVVSEEKKQDDTYTYTFFERVPS
jgi:dihydrofolate reductase